MYSTNIFKYFIYNILIIINLSIILYVLYVLYNVEYNSNYRIYREYFLDTELSYIQCVVARYNEDVEWSKTEPYSSIDTICYNKGPRIPGNCTLTNCRVINIDNVGRCDHTYLYHIIQNYNNLAPITFFMPGSCMDPHKIGGTNSVLNHILETKNTVLQGQRMSNLYKELYDFTLDNWSATNIQNKTENPESELQKCSIRPYGKWFEANFDTNLVINIFIYYGIFAVSREHIIQHPIERYENLIKYVDSHSNPEAGHYMERSWGAIFYPYPESCLY